MQLCWKLKNTFTCQHDLNLQKWLPLTGSGAFSACSSKSIVGNVGKRLRGGSEHKPAESNFCKVEQKPAGRRTELTLQKYTATRKWGFFVTFSWGGRGVFVSSDEANYELKLIWQNCFIDSVTPIIRKHLETTSDRIPDTVHACHNLLIHVEQRHWLKGYQ